MKLDLSRLDLDTPRKDGLGVLLRWWVHQVPDLKEIPPYTLLEGLGLITRTRSTMAGPVYRGTELLKECVGEDEKSLSLQEWLEFARTDPSSADFQMGCTMWVHLGRFPSCRGKAKTCYWHRLHPPKWVVKKFEKSLRNPTRERIMGIFAGPSLWSKQAVLNDLRCRRSLPVWEFEPRILGSSLWEEMQKLRNSYQSRYSGSYQSIWSGSSMGWRSSQQPRHFMP